MGGLKGAKLRHSIVVTGEAAQGIAVTECVSLDFERVDSQFPVQQRKKHKNNIVVFVIVIIVVLAVLVIIVIGYMCVSSLGGSYM